MYNIKFTDKTSDKIFLAIKKYYKKYGSKKVKNHFGINNSQLANIYQACDVEQINNFEQMKYSYNNAVGTIKKIKITDYMLKKTILLLLAYSNNIIKF